MKIINVGRFWIMIIMIFVPERPCFTCSTIFQAIIYTINILGKLKLLFIQELISNPDLLFNAFPSRSTIDIPAI